MRPARIAIDGDGPVARSVLQALAGRDDLHMVATNATERAHDARRLPWKRHAVDIVLDCRGRDARAHLKAGAGKVLSCGPAAAGSDATVVYGVNHRALRASHRVVHGACRATHSIAPVARVLHDSVGISNAMLTAVHSQPHDHAGLPALPRIDAVRHLHRVLPELDHRFDEADPMQVPGVSASLVCMVFVAERRTSVEEVNDVMQAAAAGDWADLVHFGQAPFATAISERDTRSCIFEPGWTQVSGRVVKVCAGYRGTLGYAHRIVDTARAMHRTPGP